MNTRFPILIVEDDKSLNLLIQKILKRQGFVTEGVLNGASAIDSVSSNQNTVLLLDYILPDMTGKQVISALMKKNIEVPFIIITGNGDEKTAVEMMKLGARDYIIKDRDFLDTIPHITKRVVKELAKEKQLSETQRALEESENRYRTLLEAIPDGILEHDVSGIISFSNKAYHKILGFAEGELVGKRVWDLVPESNREELRNYITMLVKYQPLPTPYFTRSRRKDGREIDTQIKWSYKRDTQGHLTGLISVLTDITDRKQVEDLLQEQKEKYRTLFEAASDAIFIVQIRAENGLYVIDCNSITLSMFRCKREEIIGRSPADFSPLTQQDGKLSCERIIELARAAMNGNPQFFEWTYCRLDGTTFAAEVTLNRIDTRNETYIQLIVKDITEWKRMEEKLRNLSNIDDLTGLYNRRGFFTLVEQQLKIASRGNREVFLLYADMDNLKRINDTFGHNEGDRALIEVANILKATYRESDIIARIGGDEFVVYQVGYKGDNIGIIANRLKRKLEICNASRATKYKLAISVGIARYNPKFPDSVDELLAKADKMMYEHKKQKQNF